ncbi:uncharacterized protein LOC141713547 isoform X2 [Apium graveolens]|uniref:uncharacterized protein LOC141713547 isoform X2 n=1 Tax=Apium graveolens TaxID=4045 RepID=UPI003D7B402A
MEQGNASSSTPCASSSSVEMISTKCAENISKSADLDSVLLLQEDDQTVKITQDTQQKEQLPAKREKPLKSEVWYHFDHIESEIKDTK